MADWSKLRLLFFLYFTQGLPYGIQTKLIPLLLRSNSVSLTKVSFSRILSFPWIFKVFIASFLNRFSTIWLWLLCSFCGMAFCCAFPGLFGTDLTFVLLLGVFGLNTMAAGQDVAVDTLAIRILDSSDLGKGNIAQVVGYKTGALIGGGLLVLLSQYASWDVVFMLLTIFYILCAFYAYNMHYQTLLEGTLLVKLISRTDGEILGNEANDFHEKMQDSSDYLEDNSFRKRRKNEGICSDKFQRNSKHNENTEKNSSSQVQTDQFATTTKTGAKVLSLTSGSSTTETSQKELTVGLFSFLLKSKNFAWIVFYVFVYKLGEQGMVSMVPLYMLDSGFTVSNVGLITGVLTQVFSIFGSTVGGWMASRWGRTCHDTIRLLKWISLARLLPMVAHCINISSTSPSLTNLLITESLLQLIAGIVTTATFTLMMQFSKNIPTSAQATHFSVLATVEVLGKLTMMSVGGGVVEVSGYFTYFVFCVVLSGAVVPVLNYYNWYVGCVHGHID